MAGVYRHVSAQAGLGDMAGMDVSLDWPVVC
jgi:hypothetical protein